ncbi:metallophosphoesterase [Hymenobacter sp. ASUV-10]|uniref:Metallophosphoesterase n=1 Tax=Hymenobacter aranciens TaxID=3063996 RepID=A0ABT9BG05_9BACT|nr:metallophosphoesterase [Hymenobacter sp. ASUV-10]MDO7877186.1 metallophosphoesterase [Hymenobacter sp. ASUV-10]
MPTTYFYSAWLRRILLLPLALLSAAGLTGCELFEFSPNEIRTTEEYHDLTRKNLDALAERPVPGNGDTLRFIFTGDPQRFYAEADELVASVNQQRDIAFVAIAGDISDFGLIREFRWVHDKMRRLHVPYLTVIGNHDHAANGRQSYQEVFGPLNYSFRYAGTQFVLVNTNGREYDFNGQVPDVGWLHSQLADTVGVRRQVVMSHVPPMDEDFDHQLEKPYVAALASSPLVMMQLNGHRHGFSETWPYEGAIPYINSASFQKNRYLIISLWGKREFKLETVYF